MVFSCGWIILIEVVIEILVGSSGSCKAAYIASSAGRYRRTTVLVEVVA